MADWSGVPLAEHRRAPALSAGGRQLSFADLAERADRVAAGLEAAGLLPGDRVLALLPSGTETYELLLGCARAGLVLVPLNWRLALAEKVAVAAHARARAVIVHSAYDELAHAVVDASATAGESPRLRLRVGTHGDYESWAAAQPVATPPRRASADEVVLQVYTSGTSGRPKGVLLTHGNLTAKVPRASSSWGLTAGSVSLLATPLFHVGGLGWGLVGLYAGAHTVIIGPAAPPELVRILREQRVTHTFLVPTQLHAVCEHAGDEGFPDLRTVVVGAAPISGPTLAVARRTFAGQLIHVYGLTETTGAITQLVLPHGGAHSAGRPYPWVELAIRDPETAADVEPGTVGEVWTRSAQNTPGYAGDRAATRALLTPDGWLRTGDAGHLDVEGNLVLTDRIKDLIVTGGENVYPAEVEAVLRQHPDVADAAVVGLPDVRWGELVTAFVVPAPGQQPRADELVAFCVGRLAGYQRPRTVHLVDQLPRTPTGKVRKPDLVAALAAGAQR